MTAQHDIAPIGPPAAAIAAELGGEGFAFCPAAETASLLGADALADWAGFAASWNDLGLDRYMADGGRYRRRRFAAFAANAQGWQRKPHQPHYQSRDYNPLHGGIARWFEPIAETTAANPCFVAILDAARTIFDALAHRPDWHVEIHQFRIEAQADMPGQPSPEGTHRDGVDYVLVLLVGRHNVASGVTTIHTGDRRERGRFTLADPLDAAWVDDWRVLHGVTPIVPVDPAQPAHRDVLVVTFRRA
jgi:hypothetical protein